MRRSFGHILYIFYVCVFVILSEISQKVCFHYNCLPFTRTCILLIIQRISMRRRLLCVLDPALFYCQWQTY